MMFSGQSQLHVDAQRVAVHPQLLTLRAVRNLAPKTIKEQVSFVVIVSA